MSVDERDPQYLIREGYLERCADFAYEGREVLASRLGHRVTRRFISAFFGRVFNHPEVVFTDEMLRPELQSLEVFVDGMDNIVETQKRVAQLYFEDGSVESACPPLRALLHIMAHDSFEGHTSRHRRFAVSSLGSRCWRAIGMPGGLWHNRRRTIGLGCGT